MSQLPNCEDRSFVCASGSRNQMLWRGSGARASKKCDDATQNTAQHVRQTEWNECQRMEGRREGCGDDWTQNAERAGNRSSLAEQDGLSLSISMRRNPVLVCVCSGACVREPPAMVSDMGGRQVSSSSGPAVFRPCLLLLLYRPPTLPRAFLSAVGLRIGNAVQKPKRTEFISPVRQGRSGGVFASCRWTPAAATLPCLRRRQNVCRN